MKSLTDIFVLERMSEGRFRGFAPDLGEARIFGGAVIAQALLAAYETVDQWSCHSLHSYFIHPGDPKQPIFYDVEQTRDGGSFATRRVIAVQGDRQILNLAASFQAPATGFDHQTGPVAPAPRPETLDDDDRRGQSVGLQLRNVGLPRPGFEPDIRPPHHQMWFRSEQPLGGDIRYHQAALAYASDFPQLPAIVQPHSVTWRTPGFQYASLDHAIWFHRPFDFTTWHLCDLTTPSSAEGRGLSRGSVYGEDGTLVASVAQEAMIRMKR